MNTNVNFAKISTKKLTTMLADSNLSEESRQAINEVLSARQQTSQNEVIAEDLTADEQAIIDQAEQAEQSKSTKLSLEECQVLADELKPNLGHFCDVVPSGTISWAAGQIVGITVDKRNNKVLYAIKLTESGKRILKAHNSTMLKISEEKNELIKKSRSSGTTEKMPAEELVAKGQELAMQIIGQKVEFEPFKPIEGVATLTGTIIGITPEKRVGKLLIKIKANHEGAELTGYKVEGNYKLLDEFDQEIKDAYMKRMETRNSIAASPEERLALVTAKLEKAKSELIKWQNLVATRTEELAKATEEYNKSIAEATEEIL